MVDYLANLLRVYQSDNFEVSQSYSSQINSFTVFSGSDILRSFNIHSTFLRFFSTAKPCIETFLNVYAVYFLDEAVSPLVYERP